MKFTRYIYAATALVALAACTKEGPVHTVGEADNAIVLKAGISEGHGSIATKAGAEDHHDVPGHLNFEADTKIALQVSGTWKVNGVVKSTTATIGASTGADSRHNNVVFASEEQLYWDDYGTADPDNAAGRAAGLTIYGVAVDGESTAPAVSNWTELAWNLAADQTSGWPAKDILISNNVGAGMDGTYRFDDRASGKLLEFTHAMSKVTVRLVADEGFLTTGIGATARKFNSLPEVRLTSNQTGQSNAEWALTSSTVDVTTGSVSNQGTPAVVTMHEQSRVDLAYTVIYDALVAPGSCFGTTDDATIARINADGNIYYVSAKEIRKKMKDLLSTTDYRTEAGKNYIITVRVKKTRIDVTATITDWASVVADEVTPVINVNASYGSDANNFPKEEFSFYRSTSLNSGYSEGVSSVNGYVPCESVVRKPSAGTEWDFDTKLYWPTHDTHYQMRGVWPCTGTETGDVAYPRVEAATHNAVEYQVIKVKNVPYVVNTFPSDLAIGRPDVAADAVCHNADHTARNLFSDGICATEGTVNLSFEYMMSQVVVNLRTTTDASRVELAGAVVEVTNLYTSGDVKLGDRDVFTTGSKSLYALNASSVANQWWDAVVPQDLANVRFKITITNSDGSKDIYYADVAPILKEGSTTEKVAPAGRWERGVHYVYNLKVAKTKIDVSATLKDWVTVNASEDVWF